MIESRTIRRNGIQTEIWVVGFTGFTTTSSDYIFKNHLLPWFKSNIQDQSTWWWAGDGYCFLDEKVARAFFDDLFVWTQWSVVNLQWDVSLRDNIQSDISEMEQWCEENCSKQYIGDKPNMDVYCPTMVLFFEDSHEATLFSLRWK